LQYSPAVSIFFPPSGQVELHAINEAAVRIAVVTPLSVHCLVTFTWHFTVRLSLLSPEQVISMSAAS
uniref:TMEM132 domain-containing protein n=1 Tax=Toxocara canis TaxID=6265 RepID=A0A183VH28_TOXCA